MIAPDNGGSHGDDCTPVDGSPELLAQILAEVTDIQSCLAEILPQYMV